MSMQKEKNCLYSMLQKNKKAGIFSPLNYRLFRKVYNLKYDTLRKLLCKIIHDVAEFVNIYEKKVEKYLHNRLCDSGFYMRTP